MLSMSVALKAHLAQPYQTTCTLWLVTQVGGTVLGFTDHDENVTFLSQTYVAAQGYSRTDIAGAADLSVDNLDLGGVMQSPAITDDSLRSGVWDYAHITVMLVNWADLSMGAAILRTGRLGEVNLGRDAFRASLHGLSQAYSRTIGENTSAGCRAQLFDSRCKVNPSGFTVAGTVTGVNSTDPTVFYDTSRTEPGPTGAVAIINVSHANPGVVDIVDATSFSEGEPVTLSGIVGPDVLNGSVSIIGLDVAHHQFNLAISTLPLPVYVSGGFVTPLGETSGYFDNGVLTWVTGANAGLSIEVRSYVPGQFSLVLPMEGGAIQVGDTYTAVAGCDKSLGTCKDRFSNVVNMRAEPYLSGNDRLVQIGKQP